MNTAPSIIVPPRPRFILNEGKILSGEFSELLQRFRQELNTIFDRESNEHASWPPENALDCFQNYPERPKLAIELAQELAQIVLELESAGGKFGDRELYAHQMGHLKGFHPHGSNSSPDARIDGAERSLRDTPTVRPQPTGPQQI